MFETSKQTGRIPIVLVVGERVSSTRSCLNILLANRAFADTVVMAVTHDSPDSGFLEPLRHSRVMSLPRLESSAQDSCLCCGMHSALGDALRSLFFEALRDRAQRLDRVLIESDSIETEQLTHTLRHTPFLGQRYFHQHTVRVQNPASDAKALLETLEIC